MRLRVLLLALAACKPEDWSWGSSLSADCTTEWSEQVIASTPAGTIVAATRDGCGFPDASIDYRLYKDGERFAEGSMETKHWIHAIGPSDAGYELRLYDQACVLDAKALRCTPCTGNDFAPCTPVP